MARFEKLIRLISVITLAGLMPAKIILGKCAVAYPSACDSALAVMVAAAVGYITNWIAIEMLFKPYEKTKWHIFSILTFGYWQQGLVPRNKDEIGVQLGRQAETRLLNPEKIASDFCALIPRLLRDETIKARIVGGIRNLISQNKAPIASKIIAAVQRRSPQIMKMAQSELRQMVIDYANARVGLSLFSDQIADVVEACINWEDVEKRLKCKIGEAASSQMIQDEIDGILDSCTVWIDTELIPSVERQIVELASGPVKDKIIANLKIGERVAAAVAQQDVREFHTMINDLAAKHLGAVQILGYFLGAAVGLVQLAG